MKLLWFAAATTLFVSNVAFANTRICVSVQQKSWYKPVAPPAPRRPRRRLPAPPVIEPAPTPPPGRANQRPTLPFGGPRRRWTVTSRRGAATAGAAGAPRAAARQSRTRSIRRCTCDACCEYEVTHEPGFAAVDDRCEQRMTVELYPLESGWTVFARYSGTEREEKIDHAELDEFARARAADRRSRCCATSRSRTPSRARTCCAPTASRTCARSTAPATSCSGWGRRYVSRSCRPQHGAGNAAAAEMRVSSRPSASRSATAASCAPGAWTPSAA